MAARAPRQKERFYVSLPLWVHLGKRLGVSPRPRSAPAAPENTFTENISTGGCYFLLSQEPPVGSEVEMEITMAARTAGLRHGKVRCRGKVVRVENGLGGGKIGVACTIEHYTFFAAAPHSREIRAAWRIG